MTAAAGLSEAELHTLDDLLGRVPAPLEPLDLTALDGYLVGVLLQPRRVPVSRWWPYVVDEDGRPLPARWPETERLRDLVLRRHAELDRLIEQRNWFDPWVMAPDEDTPPTEVVQPWVLGFATACGHFPDLTEGPAADEPESVEALAQLYQHLDPDDLEDAQALLEEIETLEPPATMEEAVESLVRGSLLLADVSRPVRANRPSSPARPAGSMRPAGSGRAAGPRPPGRGGRPSAAGSGPSRKGPRRP